MEDSPTAAELRALRDELKTEFSTITQRLTKIERQQSTQHKQSARQVQSINDALSFNQLINDALLCGVCLVVSFGITGIDVLKGKVCPQIPGWAAAAVPFNFCGSSTPAAKAISSDEAKVMAFLDTIAFAEGTGDDYQIMYTFKKFSDTSKHPAQMNCNGTGLCSDAAGRYQFLSTTWQPIADRLALPDFSAASQDKAAIQKLKDVGAYDLILKGDIAGAIAKVGPVWASFPNNDYGQPKKRSDELVAQYQQFLEKRKASAAPTGSTGSSTGWINPVPSGTFTSGFGFRMHPLAQFRRCHYGIDLAAPTGTPMLAAKAGKVDFAGDANDGYGLKIVLAHPDGTKSLYAHASKLNVSEGQQVNQGDPIALVGSTGNSSGPHLHWEVTDTNGKIIDPLPVLPEPPSLDSQPFGSIDKAASSQCVGRSL